MNANPTRYLQNKEAADLVLAESGKTTFITWSTKENLKPPISPCEQITAQPFAGREKKIAFVEIPGFRGEENADRNSLMDIAKFLRDQWNDYTKRPILGIIYLHSTGEGIGDTDYNLDIMSLIVGQERYKSAIFVINKINGNEIIDEFRNELQSYLPQGATVDTNPGPQYGRAEDIIQTLPMVSNMSALAIQNELYNLRSKQIDLSDSRLEKTGAGKAILRRNARGKLKGIILRIRRLGRKP